jgi:hypothetical protein
MKFKDCATLIWCGGVYGGGGMKNNDQNQYLPRPLIAPAGNVGQDLFGILLYIQ